ncbi:Endoribonuclease YbeY [Oligella sp. MSHR50489EDL]|uniref:rRNA maturation RNase YbeY n=1 Tax=Oligella sp. MSHR50489EDL TaxID=3139409 RepID=UPI003D81B5E3
MNQPAIFSSQQLSFVVQNATDNFVLKDDLSEESLQQVILSTIQTVQSQYETDFQQIEISLRIVDLEEAQQLNHQYRQKDYATNVLTFEYGVDASRMLSADIVICAAVVEQEAREQDKRLSDHFKHLLVHGTLHALAFDHLEEAEAEEMEALEIEILATFAIKNPYF